MTNIAAWYRWPIEIDGLPMKNGGSFHGYVTNNQMVYLNDFKCMCKLNWIPYVFSWAEENHPGGSLKYQFVYLKIIQHPYI